VARLSTQWPGLSIELSITGRKVDLIGEGFDLAVRVGELRPSGLIARRVGAYRFVCCAALAFLEQHGILTTPSDLSRQRCVLNLNLQPRDRWPFRGPSGLPFSVEISGSLKLNNDEA